ncbi:MAG: hypothetical protein H0X33_07490 [Taibaiella sp.]|nr:hypothetical protein [Taibaiella sp.]
MNERNDILIELENMGSALAILDRTMPYIIPTGYFAGLVHTVFNRMAIEDAADPVLVTNKQLPYSVPAGYFDLLPGEVMRNVDSLFATTLPDGANLLDVPSGYFESLPEKILAAAKASEQTKTKIIPLRRGVWKKVRLAAAAVLLLGIGMGIYKVAERPAPMNVANELAMVDNGAITSYISQNIDDFDQDMIARGLSKKDIDAAAEEIDAQDIQEYLDENGWQHTE